MNSVAQIYFNDKDLAERWSQVKEDFWGDIKKETLIAQPFAHGRADPLDPAHEEIAALFLHLPERLDHFRGKLVNAHALQLLFHRFDNLA